MISEKEQEFFNDWHKLNNLGDIQNGEERVQLMECDQGMYIWDLDEQIFAYGETIWDSIKDLEYQIGVTTEYPQALWSVDCKQACFGVVTNKKGLITECAPYGRKWLVGKHIDTLLKNPSMYKIILIGVDNIDRENKN